MSRVRLVNISKYFGSTPAVQEIDLDVAEGEFLTLLGPSGCGKTTTLRMIAGLIEPTTGQVLFDDQDVTDLPPNRRNIGFVFQSPALFPHMSVADNIGFGLSVRGRKKEICARVKDMLQLVDLVDYGHRLPGQLSGGQQQRVALARVLATDPRVLLFDEPLSALDRNLREMLKFNILELQRKTGKTAIYVTHDQSEAFAISDRIAVMNQGRIEQLGTQTEIYLHPQSDFVAEFIGANNQMDGQVTGSEDDTTVVQVDGLTLYCPGHPKLRPGDAVAAYIRPENISVIENDHGRQYRNLVEGTVEQIIFEGATAQLHVNVKNHSIRVDVSGEQRLKLLDHQGHIRLGFDEITLISRA